MRGATDSTGLDLPFEEESWVEVAACKNHHDPKIFFPGKFADTSEAREICAGCAVRLECLEHALRTNEKYGIWGGLSERERRRVKRKRRVDRA